MSFKSDMLRIARDISVDIEDLAKAIKIEVFRRAIMNTRVDTGRAKGNWQVTEGSPSSSSIENFDKSVTGDVSSETINEMDNVIHGISVSFLTNNLPYIQKLEELDAMVAVAVFQVEEVINEYARR